MAGASSTTRRRPSFSMARIVAGPDPDTRFVCPLRNRAPWRTAPTRLACFCLARALGHGLRDAPRNLRVLGQELFEGPFNDSGEPHVGQRPDAGAPPRSGRL